MKNELTFTDKQLERLDEIDNTVLMFRPLYGGSLSLTQEYGS